MKQKNNAALKSLCAEVRPDDGIAPHLLKRQKQKQHPNRQHGDHHQRQLCRAAQRSLDGALAGLGGGDLTNDLSIVSVEPVPGGSVLMVIVGTPSGTLEDIAAIESLLSRSSGLLRASVAGDIRRKRVPHLRFRVIPTGA